MESTSFSKIHPRAKAIQPRRQAGEKRYQTVLNGADALLLEQGLGAFSVPALAERLGFTRRSIYKFFPTPYAILNELTLVYLERLEQLLQDFSESVSADCPWEESVMASTLLAAQFHNDNPVARILILGGAVTDESFRATEYSIRKLGGLLVTLLMRHGCALPGEPDVASLAVDIATSVFRVSNLYHGHVNEVYGREAGRAMIAYLRIHIEAQ